MTHNSSLHYQPCENLIMVSFLPVEDTTNGTFIFNTELDMYLISSFNEDIISNFTESDRICFNIYNWTNQSSYSK